jgi:uncharacterized protein (DUF1330 family)
MKGFAWPIEVSVMAKGYWITCYRSVPDEATIRNYARLAGPAIEAHGGRFLARKIPAKAYEFGLNQRLVIIEFESVKKAIKAYESPEYQAALAILKDSAERDVRII